MHTILKGSEWVLSAERGAGAPESMYGVECLTCRAESGWVDNHPRSVEVWTIEHTRQHGPGHGQFLVTTQKHWRVDPVRQEPGARRRPALLRADHHPPRLPPSTPGTHPRRPRAAALADAISASALLIVLAWAMLLSR